MSTNRADLLTETFKVLKKHYKAVAPPDDRSVLEHLLYAACLQNSKHEDVDEVIAKLQQNYFDWNEVRVTTVSELAEVMSVLVDPSSAASRLKRSLHSVFETHYTFDLEPLKKQNLGAAIKEVEYFNGVTPFSVAYVTQNALGGHSIPVNQSGFDLLVVIGAITPTDVQKRRVPGMERAIPKSKGVEFGSLLHQLTVDYGVSPFSPRVRSIVLEIAPDAKERLPKRGAKKAAASNTAQKKKAPRAAKSRSSSGKKSSGEATKKKSATKRLTRKKPR
jgi:endonuclease-3